MKNIVLPLKLIQVLCLCGLFFANSAYTHGRYLVPSHTVLSGADGQTITLYSSISNDIFHPDRPLGNNEKGIKNSDLNDLFKVLKTITVTPDNSKIINSWQAFSRYSVTDLVLDKEGTYNVLIAQPQMLMTTYLDKKGNPGRQFGPKPKIPEGATKINRITTHSNTQAFITLNKPTFSAIKPIGKGLELKFDTHPNDLFKNEEASFQLYINGKPIKKSVEVQFIREGTRHRNNREPMMIKTDENGKFNVAFEQAGLYMLEATYMVKGSQGLGVSAQYYGLYATLEVFAE